MAGSVDRAVGLPSVRRARWAWRIAAATLVALVLILLAAVPAVPTSQRITVPAGDTGSSTHLKFLLPTEVVVRFATRGTLESSMWVTGPGLGSGIQASAFMGDTGAGTFWTWGGPYNVRIGEFVSTGPIGGCTGSDVTVWVNVTAGVL